ncbi:MAG: elongation factor G [Acidobacteria bacterium]|nr:MAG: elongation factor G [Acidobacteriota bacterium]
MKIYEGQNVRNVALVGHGDTGKTQLVSALLYTAGMVNRLGKVDDGTSVTDYDEEEIQRKFSISASLAYAEWGKTKINFIDTPGFNIFLHETEAALVAAESALLVVHAVAGVEVQTEKTWGFCERYGLPRAFVVNQMDRDRASFDRTLGALREAFGRQVVPVQLPLGEEKGFRGAIDLVRMKAAAYEPNGTGKAKESDIPSELSDAATEAHEALVEMVAEGNDKLMEEFFDKGTIPVEDLMPGIKQAASEKRLYPVVVSAGLPNIGSDALLNFMVDYLPSPLDRGEVEGLDHEGGKTIKRKMADDQPVSAYVFKTMADPFAGRVSYFKVMSGVVKNEANLTNFTRGGTERLSHIAVIQGKAQTPVAELHAGDLGVVAKLRDTLTGDTLGDKSAPIVYPKVKLAEPAISFAVEPKSRGDEDKLSTAIHRMLEEDQLLRFSRDAQTKEFLISGSGQQHLEVAVSKLKRRFNLEVTLKAPKVPYRETIRGKADAQGKHKKQTGGHGQYGDCKIKLEPLARGAGFEFVNDIFGGAIPKNFIPAVEKGIIDAASRGYLAGCPVVDFRVILYDGSYHEVDSSEIAFKLAGSKAFKKAIEQAKPCLIEPIMNVEITVPENYAGDIMGNLNGRRGRVQGMDAKGGSTVIKAQAPLSEMLTYASDLTSMTQGRGTYSMEFSHYDIVPQPIADKIIAAHRPAAEEEEE